MANKNKYDWYKVTKTFRGGENQFQIRVPKTKLSKDDWQEILDYIGENTNGGHSAGYNISTCKLKKKSLIFPVVKYPANLCCALEGYGSKVVTVKYMI